MKITSKLLGVGFVAILSAACSAAPVEGPPSEKPAATLASPLLIVQLPGDHTLEFYNFGNGSRAVHELAHESVLAHGAKLLLDGTGEIKDLAEAFRQLQPGREVPAAVLDADKEANEFLAREAIENAGRPPKPQLDDKALQKAVSQANGVGVTSEALAAPNCSGDLYGDNWGAAWFQQNYCGPSSFLRECHTNWGWYDTFESYGYNLYNSQFEGDFNVAGNEQGYLASCGWNLLYGYECWYVQQYNQPVPPRHVSEWHFFGDDGAQAHMTGASPCGHLGIRIFSD